MTVPMLKVLNIRMGVDRGGGGAHDSDADADEEDDERMPAEAVRPERASRGAPQLVDTPRNQSFRCAR